jgi:hypothetical protein
MLAVYAVRVSLRTIEQLDLELHGWLSGDPQKWSQARTMSVAPPGIAPPAPLSPEAAIRWVRRCRTSLRTVACRC